MVPASNGQWGFIGQQNPCSGYIVGHSETDPLAFLFRSGGRGRLPDGVRGKQSFSTRDSRDRSRTFTRHAGRRANRVIGFNAVG